MEIRQCVVAAAVVIAMVIASACTDDGGSSQAVATAPGDGAALETAPPSSPPSSSGSPAAPHSPRTTAKVAPDTVVSDTGVPGIDSDDVFCRSWSEFAGSFQALALASDLAADQRSPARAEVAAAGAIIAAADGLANELPAELEPERDAFTIEFIGPMVRRAQRSADELSAAGLDERQIDQLGSAWLDALVAAGLNDPDIAVATSSELAGPLDQATEVVSASRPSIATDPSLITNASTPLTLSYLSENCPDQGILAGNDVVDQP